MILCPLCEGISINIASIKLHLILIHDERQNTKVDYLLFDILFGNLCTIIAGGDGSVNM